MVPVGLDDLVVQRDADAAVRREAVRGEVIVKGVEVAELRDADEGCLLYTSPSPRD